MNTFYVKMCIKRPVIKALMRLLIFSWKYICLGLVSEKYISRYNNAPAQCVQHVVIVVVESSRTNADYFRGFQLRYWSGQLILIFVVALLTTYWQYIYFADY